MKHNLLLLYTSYLLFLCIATCQAQTPRIGKHMSKKLYNTNTALYPIPAANSLHEYLPLLKNKKVGLVINHTSTLQDSTHLVDVLLKNKVNVQKIFAPEHGFRGTASAGEKINNQIDPKTQLPIISLYGKHKKPTPEDFQNIDILIFDIQDVGVRFYTYISTLHYVMEACAENQKPLIVLDRPNPNGHYVDGEVLQPAFKSFVGMHPIPVVYGLTIGELAMLINGEGWLTNQVKCDLTVIKCQNYTHLSAYEPPIAPSPNLPNLRSIYLYPALCFFEGTNVSVGRGTEYPFQIFGAPHFKVGNYAFTPKANEGAKNPPYQNQICYGVSLANLNPTDIFKSQNLNLQYLISTYQTLTPAQKQTFFNKDNFFDKLAGSNMLQQQIKQGLTEAQIRSTWEKNLTHFKQIRKKYILYYPDFE